MTNKKVTRAGVIPYYIDDDTIYMMFMKPSNPKFGGIFLQCCKGKVDEEDPDVRHAAFREAEEELGLFQGNVISEFFLGTFLGRTSMYVCKIHDPDMFGDPCFETEYVRWMTPDHFDQEGRSLHQPIVKAAVRCIKKREDIN